MMNRLAEIKTTISYMDEAGWFDGNVFVVWLNGCTDGWPQAIFNSKNAAEDWVTNIYLNPEGFLIEEVNFVDLCAEIGGVGER